MSSRIIPGSVSTRTQDCFRSRTLLCTDSNGNIALMQAVSMATTLAVTGKATLNGGLAVTSGTTTDTLAVTGTSTFTGKATHNGGVAVTGGTTTDTLAISGSITHSGVAQAVTSSEATT